MHDSRSMHVLMMKLVDVRTYAEEQFPLAAPSRMARHELDGFLRFSQSELIEMFGEKTARNMPDSLRLAIVVLSRIHTGSECYGTVAECATRLIKAMHPLYLVRLKRHELITLERVERAALEESFARLMPGKALPDGIVLASLREIINDLQAA